jgi:hypothetical protein
MSAISRIVLAGVICAALGAVQASAAERGDDPGSTRGRLFHASKCVMTLGFSGGCDKDEADSKVQRPAVTKVADEHSTRAQFAHASKCVMSFGFIGHCDRNAPQGPAAGARADAAPAAPDNSTAGQFKRASKCVVSFGFLGDCDKK